jgi:hypothetical protein
MIGRSGLVDKKLSIDPGCLIDHCTFKTTRGGQIILGEKIKTEKQQLNFN